MSRISIPLTLRWWCGAGHLGIRRVPDPHNAQVIAIDEAPLDDTMVYQSLQATSYLEGDVAITLTLLLEAVHRIGVDEAKIAERAYSTGSRP